MKYKTENKKKESLSNNAAEIRAKDPDRFLVTLFAPSEVREALFALYALNLEVAKTRQVAKEIATGQIRLQWWQDEIDSIYSGKAAMHHTTQILQKHVARLSQPYFHDLIDAWENDLFINAFATLDEITDHIQKLSLPVFRLAEQIEGKKCEGLDKIILAWGMSQMIRALPVYQSYGRDILSKDIIVHDLWQVGIDALAGLDTTMPRNQKSHLFLYASLAKSYLQEIQRVKFEPQQLNLEKRPFGAVVKLLISHYSGRLF